MELITLALSLCLAFNPAPQADSVYFINAEDHIADFFHITAIKETANNYIIYAKFDGQKYKIISEKGSPSGKERIRVGRRYYLNIKSRFPRRMGKYRFPPPGSTGMSCVSVGGEDFYVDDSDKIVTDLFYPVNLNGLELK